jgi:hypothetical protein
MPLYVPTSSTPALRPAIRTPEELMRFMKSTAIALTLFAVAGTTASLASEPKENMESCLVSLKQVSAALDTASSQSAKEASSERQLGIQFCNAGYYHLGVKHYARAMELLGQKLALAQ